MNLSAEMKDVLRVLERERCKADPFYLANVINGHTYFNAGRSQFDWHHALIMATIKQLYDTREEREITRIWIELPRGSLKSTTVTEAMTMWFALNDPNTRILLDSCLKTNAQAFLMNIRAQFEAPYFQYLFGQLYDPKNRWSNEELVLKRTQNNKEPTIMASGLDASKTSKHFPIIIFDDLVGETNYESPEMVEKAVNRARLYGSLLDRHGFLIGLGTRWAINDPGGWIEKQNKQADENFKPRPWIVLRWVDYIGGDDKNMPEFPKSLPRQRLESERAAQGEELYSYNYRLNPVNSADAPFKKEWFHLHNRKKSDFDNAFFYIAVDPRKNEKQADQKKRLVDKRDYDAIIVAAVDDLYNVYIMEVIRDRFSEEELLDKIFELSDFYQPLSVGFEKVFEQNALYLSLKIRAERDGKVLPLRTFPNQQTNKDFRIRGLTPLLQSGKFFFKEEHARLEHELFHYPKLDHDDVIDATAHLKSIIEFPKSDDREPFFMKKDWLENWDKDKGPPPDPNMVADLRAQYLREKGIQKRTILARQGRKPSALSALRRKISQLR